MIDVDAMAEKLKGRTIIDLRWLSDTEAEQMGWDSKAPVLMLDDGTAIWPSSDDEGNSAGALFTTIEGMDTIAVLPLGGDS